MTASLGWLGTGRMGTAMAGRLRNEDFLSLYELQARGAGLPPAAATSPPADGHGRMAPPPAG